MHKINRKHLFPISANRVRMPGWKYPGRDMESRRICGSVAVDVAERMICPLPPALPDSLWLCLAIYKVSEVSNSSGYLMQLCSEGFITSFKLKHRGFDIFPSGTSTAPALMGATVQSEPVLVDSVSRANLLNFNFGPQDSFCFDV